ncbi:MAG: hypothetical protein JF614_13795 [Acidobacteria bacterium]|nr:hypothetical protein [Acidobacteriota bacterium]
MKRVVRRSTAFLVLTLALVAAAQAAPSPRRSAPAAPASLLTAAWTWIARHVLPAPSPPLTPITEKAGCDIDPNGRMLCAPAPPQRIDEGCEMDPNGR